MKSRKKFIFNLICIITGLFAFISVNIAYALSKVQEFISKFGLILIIIPLILIAAFIVLLSLSNKWNEKKEHIHKNIIKYVFGVTLGGWVLLAGCIYFFREEVLYTNSPVRQALLNKIDHQDSFEKISIM